MIDIIPKQLTGFQYDMSLYKMNETTIGSLTTAFNKNINEKVNSSNTLTFSLPLYIQDTITHKAIRNPQFDLVQPNLLVKLYKPSKISANNEWNINLILVAKSYNEIDISWNTTNIKYFKKITIVRATGNVNISSVSDGTVITTSTTAGIGSFIDTTVTPNTTYTYKAFVECLNDNTNNLIEVLGNTQINVFASIETGNAEFYIIQDVELSADTKQIKNITAYSREFLLGKKILRKYKTTTKLHTNDGTGILDKIANMTGWNVDYNIPDVFKDEYRTIDVDNKKVLDFLINDIPTAFGDNCLIVYDTMNKTISVKDLNNYGENKGLFINNRNYMKSLKQTVKPDDIVTVLSCFGTNDLSINGVNVTGQNYIENYDYYKVTQQMSSDLVNALNSYDSFLSTKTGIFSNYLLQLNGNQTYKYQGEVATFADISKKYQVADDKWLVVVTADENYISKPRTYYVYSDTSASWVYQGEWDITVTGLYNELSVKQESYDTVNEDYKDIQTQMDALMNGGLTSSDDYTSLVSQRDTKLTDLTTATNNLNSIKQQINAIQISLNVTNTATSNGSITLTIDSSFIIVSVLKTDTSSDIATKIVKAINSSNNNNFFVTSSGSTVNINYYVDSKIASDTNVECKDTSNTGLIVSVASKTDVGYMQQIMQLQKQVDRLNYWTSQYGITKANQLMNELKDFQFMDTYQNDNVSDANRLMDLGKQELAKKSIPLVEYVVDAISFTQVASCVNDWSKLVLYDKINVEYSEFGLQAELRLIEISLDIDSNKLTLSFSTIDKPVQDVYQQIQNQLMKAYATADQLKVNLQDMKNAVQTTNSNSNVLDSDWDCTKRNIKAGSNNNTQLNERGLLMVDINNSDNQMLLQNSGLYMTSDNWKTVTEAVSAANGVKSKSILTDNGTNQRIQIGDYFGKNDGSAYMIQFLDENSESVPQAKIYYVADSKVFKIMSMIEDMSVTCGANKTLYLGNYDSENHQPNGTVDLMHCPLQNAVLQNCNIQSDSVTVNSINLADYIKQVMAS